MIGMVDQQRATTMSHAGAGGHRDGVEGVDVQDDDVVLPQVRSPTALDLLHL